MCTVSFIPFNHGYRLGMNRDEQRTRFKGIFPKPLVRRGVEIVGPCEPSGGRWIVTNSAGVTFALLNWYSRSQPDLIEPYSRGELVDSLACLKSLGEVEDSISNQPLGRIRPFRLLGVSQRTELICEWRWDGVTLEKFEHPWSAGLWASSGYDESGAQENRRMYFDLVSRERFQTSAGMRAFHGSHDPTKGALSVCMHRREAATVSYTEVTIEPGKGAVFYLDGPLCELSVGRGAETRFCIDS